MKKIIVVLLALSMLLCFAGCGAKEEVQPDAPAAPVADGWSFNYNGTEIAISADAAPIVEALGEEGSRALFMNTAPGEEPAWPEGKEDNAHTRRAGAERFAACAARGIRDLGYF